VDVRVRVYPVRRSGFFITGGFGVGTFAVADIAEVGRGLVFGFGWDVRVSRNISLTPFYNEFAMSTWLVDANVAQVGLAITIH
jgi:hypothetical protein